MRPRLSSLLYDASLFTLPWIGVGVIRLATGVDAGAGLQPAWLLLAFATLAIAVPRIGVSGLRSAGAELVARLPKIAWLGVAAALAAILVSGVGLRTARVQEAGDIVIWRYVRQVVQLLIMGFFVLWPAVHTRGEARWAGISRLLLGAVILQAAYGVLQGISFYHPNALYETLERVFTSNPSILSGSEQLYLGNVFRDVPRLRGTACEPLYLGNFLVMALPWLVLAPRSPRVRIAGGATGGLLLLATWSRGAWFGFMAQIAVAFVLWLVLRRRTKTVAAADRRRTLRIVGVVLLAVLAGGLVVGFVFGGQALLLPVERMAQSFSSQDWSNLTRLYSMQAAWRTFQLSPVVGVGWGQFAWHFPVVVDPRGLDSQFDWPMVNNFPLQILCETGLIGVLVFLGIAVALVLAVGRRLRSVVPPHPALVPAVLSLIGVWAQLLTFSQYNLPHIWVALGLLLAALADDAAAPGTEEA